MQILEQLEKEYYTGVKEEAAQQLATEKALGIDQKEWFEQEVVPGQEETDEDDMDVMEFDILDHLPNASEAGQDTNASGGRNVVVPGEASADTPGEESTVTSGEQSAVTEGEAGADAPGEASADAPAEANAPGEASADTQRVE